MSFDHWQLCHIIMLLGQLFFSCPLSNIYICIYINVYIFPTPVTSRVHKVLCPVRSASCPL